MSNDDPLEGADSGEPRGCEPGEHRWERTGIGTGYGEIYQCQRCGEREVEP